MEDLSTSWHSANVPLRPHITYPVSHRREAIRVPETRFAVSALHLRHDLKTHFFAECDKSFTRSDALAKHMRIQHNIAPPAPGRGGNRKRKREEPEAPAQASAEGYSTFKVDPPEVPEFEDGPSLFDLNGEHGNGVISRRSATPDIDDEDDLEEDIPAHLLEQMDKNTGLILGRTPTMVKYLVMKAKHQYVLEDHASLIEELKMVRHEEKCWRERKDALLDEVLRATFG